MRKEKPVWKLAKPINQKNRFESLITDAIFLALASVAGYSCAFMFEYGYARHFGIPIYFVSPDYSAIAGALLGIGAIFLFSTQFFSIVNLVFRDVRLPKLKARIYLLLIFTAMTIAQYGMSLRSLGVVLMLVIVVAGSYIFSMLEYEGTLEEKFAHAEKHKDPHVESDIVTSGLKKIGPWSLIIYTFVIFVPILSLGAGAASARMQVDYQLIKELPGYALIKRDGGNYIAIRYDKKLGKVSEAFIVFKDDELKKMTLINERIGPLECAICLR